MTPYAHPTILHLITLNILHDLMSRQEALALLTVNALLSLYLRDMGGTRCDENLEPGVRLDTAERVSAILCFYLDF